MRVSRRVVLGLFGGSLLSGTARSEGGLAGSWRGTWIKADDAIDVTVRFAATPAGWTGQFDSDDLQVANIRLSDISHVAPSVTFALAGDQSTIVFAGALDGDLISGLLTEGQTGGSFRLQRDGRAPAAASTVEEEIQAAVGDVRLAGTLFRPSGPGPHPAIVFLHGSGPEGRQAAGYLARQFAGAGFAAATSDKRGVGASTGDWRQAGFEDLAGDAAAWVALLRGRADIAPDRIGLFGHSQGGAISPLAARKAGDVAFVIASAASGLSPAETEVYSVLNGLNLQGADDGERAAALAFVRGIVAVGYEGSDRGILDDLATRYADRSWWFDPPPADHPYWALSARFAAYDPTARWREVTAPVLLLYGANDARVPPEPSARAIRAALREAGNPDVTLKVFEGADHAFRLEARPGGWPRRVAGYADVMVEWAGARVGLRA